MSDEVQTQGTELTVSPDQFLRESGLVEKTRKWWSTLVPKSKDESMLLYNLIHHQGQPFDAYIDSKFTLVAFLITPVAITSETTGEIEVLPLIKLLTANGDILHTTGRAVPDQLLDACKLIHMPTMENPLHCVIKRIATKPPRSMYVLEVTP